MCFNGQNRKKFRKRTLIIFRFYMKICPPTFSGGPLGWENDIFSKNRPCLVWLNIIPESVHIGRSKNHGLGPGQIPRIEKRFWLHVYYWLIVWCTNIMFLFKATCYEEIFTSYWDVNFLYLWIEKRTITVCVADGTKTYLSSPTLE